MHAEVKHPCVQRKAALLRDKDTGHKQFRELAREITMFVCYEPLKTVEVDPDVPVYAAAVDSHLDARKFIVPGLSDAGDRLFGTVWWPVTAASALAG